MLMSIGKFDFDVHQGYNKYLFSEFRSSSDLQNNLKHSLNLLPSFSTVSLDDGLSNLFDSFAIVRPRSGLSTFHSRPLAKDILQPYASSKRESFTICIWDVCVRIILRKNLSGYTTMPLRIFHVLSWIWETAHPSITIKNRKGVKSVLSVKSSTLQQSRQSNHGAVLRSIQLKTFYHD